MREEISLSSHSHTQIHITTPTVANMSTPSLSADTVRLYHTPLEPHYSDMNALVGAAESGAISSFIGTTRNSFQGKQ